MTIALPGLTAFASASFFPPTLALQAHQQTLRFWRCSIERLSAAFLTNYQISAIHSLGQRSSNSAGSRISDVFVGRHRPRPRSNREQIRVSDHRLHNPKSWIATNLVPSIAFKQQRCDSPSKLSRRMDPTSMLFSALDLWHLGKFEYQGDIQPLRHLGAV